MKVKDIRRHNFRALAKSIGGVTAVAKRLNKSQSQISHVIGIKPIKNIGDRLAAQIEEAFNKPPGWLDQQHPDFVADVGMEPMSYKHGDIVSWVPLIHWQQIVDWHNQPATVSHLIREHIPINFKTGKDAFALRLEEENFAGIQDFSLPEGTVVIIDPSHNAENNDYIIAMIKNSQEITIRQYIKENDHTTLKSLTPKQDSIYAPESYDIIGVVREIILRLC